jgi:hypothetical protein
VDGAPASRGATGGTRAAARDWHLVAGMTSLQSEKAVSGRLDRPVLYLDLDDTVLAWVNGSPGPARGAREFVLWALERFEVRWLTTWCPSGEMEQGLLADLCLMLDLEPETLCHIRGFDWESTASKLNGIAWLEHLVLKRPFLWVEDDYGVGEREIEVLRGLGLEGSYIHCNVTHDPLALQSLHAELVRLASR